MWQVECAINTAKSLLPFQNQLRAAKRRLTPPKLTIVHELALKGGLKQIAELRRLDIDLGGKTALEIGSGWYPVIPLVFRAAGAERVYLTDAHRLLHPRTVVATAEFLLARKERIAAELGVSEGSIEALFGDLHERRLDALLERLGLSYIAPFDASKAMPQVDVVFSHTVLEHIPPEVLAMIFKGVKSGLKPGGVMSHGIDHSDHRTAGKKEGNLIDFLRYSDRVWRLMCINPQDYTNRLRHPDYLRLLDESGYEVIFQNSYVSQGSLRALETMPLAERFRGLDPTDVCTTWSHLIARPKQGVGSKAA